MCVWENSIQSGTQKLVALATPLAPYLVVE